MFVCCCFVVVVVSSSSFAALFSFVFTFKFICSAAKKGDCLIPALESGDLFLLSELFVGSGSQELGVTVVQVLLEPCAPPQIRGQELVGAGDGGEGGLGKVAEGLGVTA